MGFHESQEVPELPQMVATKLHLENYRKQVASFNTVLNYIAEWRASNSEIWGKVLHKKDNVLVGLLGLIDIGKNDESSRTTKYIFLYKYQLSMSILLSKLKLENYNFLF